jgi:sialate O-acetylesterase
MESVARMKHLFRLAIAFQLLLSAHAFGNVRLPHLLSQGMVLQRDAPIRVWGWASPGDRVTVSFLGDTVSTTAAPDSAWEVVLPPTQAGGPYTMEIRGGNRIRIDDVLIGDVWVCSGQSNMELPMRRVATLYPDEPANAPGGFIRQFAVAQTCDFVREHEDVGGGIWVSESPKNVMRFSAVAYFFAKQLYTRHHVPIGLINASLGGAPAQAFMSAPALREFPWYLAEQKRFQSQSVIDSITRSDREMSRQWYQTLREKDSGYAVRPAWTDPSVSTASWLSIQLPGFWDTTSIGEVNGVLWFRRTVEVPRAMVGKPARLLLGRIVDADSVSINGVFTGTTGYQYPPREYTVAPGLLREGANTIVVRVISTAGRGGFVPDKPYTLSAGSVSVDLCGQWSFRLGATMPRLADPTFVRWKPGGLYNAMIAPLRNTGIAGVIWYQGESNTSSATEYRALFPALIRDWRAMWRRDNLPFLFVQLPNFQEPREQPGESEWAMLREAQQGALGLPNTAMAVAIDIGEWNDIHPLNKRDVGVRLALAAEHVVYRDTTGVWSGPIYKSMVIDHDSIRIHFSEAGGGLIVKGGSGLQEFTIAGADRQFVRAHTRIEKQDVVVWSESVTNPLAVRYAWADNPARGKLYNSEGLPASPFRTDTWSEEVQR